MPPPPAPPDDPAPPLAPLELPPGPVGVVAPPVEWPGVPVIEPPDVPVLLPDVPMPLPDDPMLPDELPDIPRQRGSVLPAVQSSVEELPVEPEGLVMVVPPPLEPTPEPVLPDVDWANAGALISARAETAANIA